MGMKEFHTMLGTDRSGRIKDDFYETPTDATEDLLDRVNFHGITLEPSCGQGAISKVMTSRHYQVLSYDLVDRGYGVTGVDFLDPKTEYPDFNHIVTNPPYGRLAGKFVRKALDLTEKTGGKVAMLTRLSFLEGITRKTLFQDKPLDSVYVFSRRLGFTKGGVKHDAGMVAYCWIIWDWSRPIGLDPSIKWI